MRFSPVLWCCLGCALLVHARAAAVECEGMPLDARPSSPPAVSIQGRSSVSVPLRIPAGAEAFLFAREQGIDVSVVLRRQGHSGTVAADNPVRRTGVQRVRLAPVVDGQYTVEVTGKEHRNARGTVHLAVWVPGAGSSQTCLRVQRAMAAGDEAFALGQSVSQGSAPSAATDAGAAYRKGRADYQRAAEQFAADDTGTLRAHAEHSLTAILYQNVQDWTQAEAWAGRAASSYQASGDSYGRARAMALQAAATMEVALTPRTASSTTTAAPQSMSSLLTLARSQLNDLAAFHASRGETYDQALALNNVGLAYYYEGLYDQAIDAYGSALRLQRSLGETTREAQILQNIALVESEIGRFTSAITRYEQVLALLDRDEAARLYADVLNNSAMTRAATGDLDTALRQYGEAEQIYEQRQITRELARTLHGIGFVYYRLGDQQLALEYFERALALRSAALDARGRTASLRATASVLRDLGKVEEGLALHREALELAGAPSMRARILVEIAKDQLLLGRTAAASEAIESVLRQEVAGDEMVSAMARQQRGRLRAKLGSAAEAETDFLAARDVFVANDSPSDRFAVELDLAVLARERGRATNALRAVDAALALAEEVRLQTSNPELRATLFQPLRPACDLKISLLAEQYFSQAPGSAAQRQELALGALAAAEQCRARALADFRALRSPTQAGAEQEARRQSLYRELATRRYQLEVRLDRSGPADPRVAAMRAEIASLRREIDTLNAGLGATRSSQARTGLRPRLEALGDDVAVIAYWIGRERSLAWVLTRQSVDLVQLAAPQEINEAARHFHVALSSLSSASADARVSAAERMHALIVQSLESAIAGKRTLIVAPDGMLHYIPFAALRSTRSARSAYLVETHDIAIAPSVSVLFEERRAEGTAKHARQLLILSDPVYDRHDARLARAASSPATASAAVVDLPKPFLRSGIDVEKLSRLQATAREASAIRALLPADEVRHLEGFQASRHEFLGAPLEQFRFIHVASHGYTDSELPQLSALVLSTWNERGARSEGRVWAADLLSKRLTAEVVVLSACETALGRNVEGEGLMGLRYIVLARGARSVVASLWQVPDAPTSELMQLFYRGMLGSSMNATRALSGAMRDWLRSGRNADPALWSGFSVLTEQI